MPCTHTSAHTRTRTNTRTHTYTRTHARTRTGTRTRTRTHTHTCTRTYTHLKYARAWSSTPLRCSSTPRLLAASACPGSMACAHRRHWWARLRSPMPMATWPRDMGGGDALGGELEAMTCKPDADFYNTCISCLPNPHTRPCPYTYT